MPANLTIFAHFSMSSAMNAANSAGDTAWTVTVFGLDYRRRKEGVISLFSLSTISTGVFLGAPTPDQVTSS
jgi:hypothetical protein